jgi:hypothetical protein
MFAAKKPITELKYRVFKPIWLLVPLVLSKVEVSFEVMKILGHTRHSEKCDGSIESHEIGVP